eukprot:603360-Rhodomonas_salina.1
MSDVDVGYPGQARDVRGRDGRADQCRRLRRRLRVWPAPAAPLLALVGRRRPGVEPHAQAHLP